MTEPNNLEWLDKVIDELYTYAYQSGEKFMTGLFKKNVKANAKLAITAKISEIVDEIIGDDDLWDKKYALSIKQDIKSRNHLRLEQRKRKDEVLG